MSLSLYELSVPSYLQILGAVSGYLEKGAKHCEAAGVDPETLVAARLIGDMAPLKFQIVSVAHHSLGAIKGATSGVFEPPAPVGDLDYAALRALVVQTQGALSALDAEAVNALQGKDMVFAIGGRTIPFVAENFILSFSLPNFYFHATTGYDILRANAVPLGKRDYLGQLRIKI
ncbi:DUF1993 domain-containing protein [soil metagenome]